MALLPFLKERLALLPGAMNCSFTLPLRTRIYKTNTTDLLSVAIEAIKVLPATDCRLIALHLLYLAPNVPVSTTDNNLPKG